MRGMNGVWGLGTGVWGLGSGSFAYGMMTTHGVHGEYIYTYTPRKTEQRNSNPIEVLAGVDGFLGERRSEEGKIKTRFWIFCHAGPQYGGSEDPVSELRKSCS